MLINALAALGGFVVLKWIVKIIYFLFFREDSKPTKRRHALDDDD